MTGKTIDNMTKCKIIEMNEQNISMRKIAKHLNTTHATVSRIINR